MICSLVTSRRKIQRKQLTQLYVKDTVKSCTLIWRKKKKEQESRMEYFLRKKKKNQLFLGRNAEITVDLVLQAGAKFSDNKVNGPEDAIMSENGKDLHNCEVVSVSVSWLDVLFLRKPEATPKKGPESFRAIALTWVMSKWCASCITFRLGKEEEPQKWKNLHRSEFLKFVEGCIIRVFEEAGCSRD